MPDVSPLAQDDFDSTGQADNDSFYAAVEEVVQVIRPAIQADNGDIFLRGADPQTGLVQVELVGACLTCPISSQTLKDGLERILKQRVEGVSAVEHSGAPLVGYDDDGTPVSL